MKTVDQVHVFSASVEELIRTGAITDVALAKSGAMNGAEQARWQSVIDHPLTEWGGNQQGRDDDGVEWPNSVSLRIAKALALALQQGGICAPTRVVPSGEGGVVFELQHGAVIHTFEIDADGSIEFCRFENAKLAARTRIARSSAGEE